MRASLLFTAMAAGFLGVNSEEATEAMLRFEVDVKVRDR